MPDQPQFPSPAVFGSADDLAFDREHIWHPYTSAVDPLPVYPVRAAHGCRLELCDGRELIDGMASWWCMIHGYNHPRIDAAVRDQLGRMAHVMFGGITHAPAVELARRLVAMTPEPLTHVFFADSGSVSVEVALKMAVQYWRARGESGRNRFLALRNAYHGDTLGAMSVCDPVTGMHALFRGYLPEQVFTEAPRCAFDAPWDEAYMADFAARIEAHASELAAVILEPVVQGAGGMRMYSPQYLRRARELCDRFGVLLIADEIATGFGRTGRLFACEWADIAPDILCVGKALTGGILTLAATLATHEVACTISRDGGVFMHGPTFMGNPLACAAANASLSLLEEGGWRRDVPRIEAALRRGLAPCAGRPGVAEVRVLGTIGAVELDAPVDMARAQALFVERGVWVRPFGRLVYVMPPYVISPDDLDRLTAAVVDVVDVLRRPA